MKKSPAFEEIVSRIELISWKDCICNMEHERYQCRSGVGNMKWKLNSLKIGLRQYDIDSQCKCRYMQWKPLGSNFPGIITGNRSLNISQYIEFFFNIVWVSYIRKFPLYLYFFLKHFLNLRFMVSPNFICFEVYM